MGYMQKTENFRLEELRDETRTKENEMQGTPTSCRGCFLLETI